MYSNDKISILSFHLIIQVYYYYILSFELTELKLFRDNVIL